MQTGLSVSVPPPTFRRRYLVFDVESTGLLPKKRGTSNAHPITAYPYILQLSYAIYDLAEKKVYLNLHLNSNFLLKDKYAHQLR